MKTFRQFLLEEGTRQRNMLWELVGDEDKKRILKGNVKPEDKNYYYHVTDALGARNIKRAGQLLPSWSRKNFVEHNFYEVPDEMTAKNRKQGAFVTRVHNVPAWAMWVETTKINNGPVSKENNSIHIFRIPEEHINDQKSNILKHDMLGGEHDYYITKPV